MKTEQDIGSYLELPEGRVIAYELKSKDELIKEARDIIDNAEKQGKRTLNDLNEDDKQRMRDIMRALGQKVDF